MNFCVYLFVAAAAVLVFSIRNANGAELSLCLQDVIDNECQSANNNVCSSSASPSRRNLSRTDINDSEKNSADSRSVLRVGYNQFSSNSAAAEDKVMAGLSASSRLIETQPNISAQTVKNTMEDAQDSIIDAVAMFYLSLAEAVNMSNNSGTQQVIGQSIQKVQLVELELLEQMRDAALLGLEGEEISNGGNSANETIELIRQGLKGGFAALNFEANNSYQQGNRSISDNQLQCGPTPIKSNTNELNDAASEDSEAQASMSKVNKAADDAIRKGAPPSRVNSIRKSLIGSLKDLARIAAHVRDYFTATTQIARFDAKSAEDLYLKEAKGVCKRIQEIFANLCLDLGAAAVKSDESTRKQIKDAIKELQRGIDETVRGNKMAKYYTLYGLSFERDEKTRTALFKAAAQGGKQAKVSMNERIVEGGNKAFSALTVNKRS